MSMTEIVVFDRVLSYVERRQVHNYFENRYGPFRAVIRFPRRDACRSFTRPRRARMPVKPLKRGDKIIAVATDIDGGIVGVVRARVIHAHRGLVSARSIGLGSSERGTLYRRQEGRTWAAGWDTPEALALSAEIALLVSR